MISRTWTVFTGAALCVAALSSACSSDSDNGSGDQDVDMNDVGLSDAGDTGTISGSAVIGPEGGTLTTDDGVTITVPAGAVTEAVTFGVRRLDAGSVEVPGGVTPLGPVWELTPAGQTFAVPVEVEFPATAGNDGIIVFRQDEGSTDWIPAGSGAVGSTSVNVLTSGFSRWFVASLAIPGCETGRNCELTCSARSCSGSCEVTDGSFGLTCTAQTSGVSCTCGAGGADGRSFRIEALPGPFDLAVVVWTWARYCGYPCGSEPPVDAGPDATDAGSDTTDVSLSDASDTGLPGDVADTSEEDVEDPGDVTIGTDSQRFVGTMFLENAASAPFGAAFDSALLAINRADSPVQLEIRLGGASDGPLTMSSGGTTTAVCDPCTVVLPANGTRRFSIGDAISATPGAYTGMFGRSYAGEVQVTATGDAPEKVILATHILNANTGYDQFTGLADISQTVEVLHRVDPGMTDDIYYAVPWFEEMNAYANTGFRFDGAGEANAIDTILRVVYGGDPTDTPLQYDVYILEADSTAPMVSTTSIPVCNPCSETLNPSVSDHRTHTISDYFAARGGFGTGVREGRILVHLRSGNTGAAAVGVFTTRTHSTALDADISVYPAVRLPLERSILAEPLRLAIPGLIDEAGTIAANTGGGATLYLSSFASVTTALQNPDFSVGGGVASMTLYESDTARVPLNGTNGLPICNPCTWVLGTANPMEVIRFENLPNWPTSTTVRAYARITLDSPFPQDIAALLVYEQPSGPSRRPAFGSMPVTVLPVIDGSAATEFVVPWLVERPGSTLDTDNTFDTILAGEHRGPVDGVPATTIDLGAWPSGNFENGSGAVCGSPCTLFEWSGADIQSFFGLDSLLETLTGYTANRPREGWAIIRPGTGTQGYIEYSATLWAGRTGATGHVTPLPVIPVP